MKDYIGVGRRNIASLLIIINNYGHGKFKYFLDIKKSANPINYIKANGHILN